MKNLWTNIFINHVYSNISNVVFVKVSNNVKENVWRNVYWNVRNNITIAKPTDSQITSALGLV